MKGCGMVHATWASKTCAKMSKHSFRMFIYIYRMLVTDVRCRKRAVLPNIISQGCVKIPIIIVLNTKERSLGILS